MFLGEYRLQFSGQGRVVLPRKFREELKDSQEIILSRGIDGCIWGFEKDSWEEEAKRQLQNSITDKKARDLRRYLFSAAEAVSLDSQGRFVIPKILLKYAHLEGEVILIGTGDHFEIWNLESWQNLLANISETVSREE